MYANAGNPGRAAVTVPTLRKMKLERTPIVVLTAYDASLARVADEAGVDVVLVGDSLGMVIQGEASTLPVTVADVVYHTRAVRRGLQHALLMADLPFLSYASDERALDAAQRLLGEAGADMLKLEGGQPAVLSVIRTLTEREVPVCAHLGLTPQSVLRLGGYRVQGREESARQALIAQAHAVVDAGATALVLECVPAALAAEISNAIAIPTIGIGAGPNCDGQVLVIQDLLGISSGKRPRFVKDFLAQGGSVHGAVAAYVSEVRARSFPSPEHCY